MLCIRAVAMVFLKGTPTNPCRMDVVDHMQLHQFHLRLQSLKFLVKCLKMFPIGMLEDKEQEQQIRHKCKWVHYPNWSISRCEPPSTSWLLFLGTRPTLLLFRKFVRNSLASDLYLATGRFSNPKFGRFRMSQKWFQIFGTVPGLQKPLLNVAYCGWRVYYIFLTYTVHIIYAEGFNGLPTSSQF